MHSTALNVPEGNTNNDLSGTSGGPSQFLEVDGRTDRWL